MIRTQPPSKPVLIRGLERDAPAPRSASVVTLPERRQDSPRIVRVPARPAKAALRVVDGTPPPSNASVPAVLKPPAFTLAFAQRKLGSERYRLRRLIGQGGSGQVYLADDELLEMPVAIKMLDAALLSDPDAVKGFKREARLAMQLSHRHIVRLFNLERRGLNYFVIMEYVDGRSLRDVLHEYGKLTRESVRQVVEICADAVSHAHRHGVLHNDIKPDNLLLDSRGILKVIDFGIAQLKRARGRAAWLEGTPMYMSPEQIRGEPLDESSDQFALAVVAYELLVGSALFPAENDVEKHLAKRPSLTLAGIDARVADVLARAMHPARERRYASISDFSDAFCEALRTLPADN
jgi:eukaryotic-like serine/threonine-protein kinase